MHDCENCYNGSPAHDGGPYQAGCETCAAALSSLRARVAELEQTLRVHELHAADMHRTIAALEAPPVVPLGHEVISNPKCVGGWMLEHHCVVSKGAAIICHRAIAWAIEHDQRPPHAADWKDGAG